MEAIAFEAIAQNGAISIPEQYRQLFPETVRVLVHVERLTRNEKTGPSFKAVTIRTKGFTFNREEANER